MLTHTFITAALKIFEATKAYAQIQAPTDIISITNPGSACNVSTQLGCDTSGNIGAFVTGVLLGGTSNLYTAFFGITFAALVVLGFQLVIQSRNDNGTTEALTGITQVFVGTVLVTGAGFLANAFIAPALGGGVVTQAGIDTEIKLGLMGNIFLFFLHFIYIAVALNIVIQGIRYIVALDEGNSDTARKTLLQSLGGGVVVTLADPIMGYVLPTTTNPITLQVVGIANFLATIFGFLAVIAFVVAGVMLLVSVNESLKDRARTLMIASVVTVAIVVASNAIIRITLT